MAVKRREISPAAAEFLALYSSVPLPARSLSAAGRLHYSRWEAVMRVYEVMSKAVETVNPLVAASEAKTRMRRRKIHHLVVTRGGELQGIVSERDLGGGKLPKSLGTWTVGDLMSTPVVTVTSRTPVRRAAALMKGRSIGSLVVTSANGNVAGIVTVSDLLDRIAREPVRVSKREAIRRREKRTTDWDDV